MSTFPYAPTRILQSTNDSNLLLVLQPVENNGKTSINLETVNATSTLQASSLFSGTIAEGLALGQNDASSYTAMIDALGDIYVYAGDCTSGASATKLWRLGTSGLLPGANATFEELSVSASAVGSQTLTGANQLAAGACYSPNVNGTARVYIFGGMCLSSPSSSVTAWTSLAGYSNNMLKLQPESGSDSTYYASLPTSKAPPIAEAGFTMTPLQPAVTNGQPGASQSLNQNLLLLGGHTQNAFINMSSVALFSLPEESWTFIPVDQPSSPSTELAKRAAAQVDSRSGHTAVLSADGKAVVVYGGWVGNVTQAADPQLAVLQLGQGYGGSGDWQWEIPQSSGSGPPSGSGLYGHGAAMLEGGVMIITGGYSISSPPHSKWKRQAPASSSTTYFYNTTSNTWISDYVNPVSTKPSKATGSSSAAKRAGLGVGITFGVLVVLALIALSLWYSKRQKQRRNSMNEELRRSLAESEQKRMKRTSTHQRLNSEPEIIDIMNEKIVDPRMSIHGSVKSPTNDQNAERTGVYLEVPSPTRGLRHSLRGRSGQQSLSGRRTPHFAPIQPIDERDEYDGQRSASTSRGPSELLQQKEFEYLSNVPMVDPFSDPHGGPRSSSLQTAAAARGQEIQRWVRDWNAAEALMHGSHPEEGRQSPGKTDRTSSTLSEHSTRSLLSTSSYPMSIGGTITRTLSSHSAAILGALPFRSTSEAPPRVPEHVPGIRGGSSHAQQQHQMHQRRCQSLFTAGEAPPITSGPSTAPKSSGHLKPPDTLVELPVPSIYPPTILDDTHNQSQANPPLAPNRSQSQTRALRGWIGSVKRAFIGGDPKTSPYHQRAFSTPPSSAHADVQAVPPMWTSPPKAAFSTQAAYWLSKKGAKDWNADNAKNGAGAKDGKGHAAGTSGSLHPGPRREGDDGEWDVESAVEKRVVQVMFTVPREKLRVVNSDPADMTDGESVSSAAGDHTLITPRNKNVRLGGIGYRDV